VEVDFTSSNMDDISM